MPSRVENKTTSHAAVYFIASSVEGNLHTRIYFRVNLDTPYKISSGMEVRFSSRTRDARVFFPFFFVFFFFPKTSYEYHLVG